MKKFLQTALVSFVSLSIACGDAGSEGDASASDTSMSSENTPAPAVNPVMTKTIQLSASEEVPANNSTGTGTADVSYNKDTKTLTYSVNYQALPATQLWPTSMEPQRKDRMQALLTTLQECSKKQHPVVLPTQ